MVVWVKVRVGSRCRCVNRECNETLNRSAEVYLAEDGSVLCLACWCKRLNDRADDDRATCIVCNDDWARDDRLTCSRKCEYRLRRQNRRDARSEEIVADASAT